MNAKRNVRLNEPPGLSLPCQILPPKHATGHQRLWAAVLDNALLGLAGRGAFLNGKSTHEGKRGLYDEALTWLTSTLTQPGSFIFICDHLGLDADLVRDRVLTRYRRQARGKICGA